jgi:hypothetical protein
MHWFVAKYRMFYQLARSIQITSVTRTLTNVDKLERS